MKKLLLLLTIGLISLLQLNAQDFNKTPQGGEVQINRQLEPCLSDSQRDAFKLMISNNIAQLSREGKLQEINRQGEHPLFIWPITQAAGFNYGSNWALINYIDHDPAYPGSIEDYDCGDRSYDTASGYNHQGFDIISWPFTWQQMDRNQAINIAAADGQIIAKTDGSYDRNCGSSSDQWNAIALQHDDGSVSWYGHMKNGGLTSKNIGDSVSTGEFLGVVGSSGNSSQPHIHFEVYDSGNQLIDPSIGPCNNFNVDTWWLDQKPYLNAAVNAALTHTAPPDFGTCPNPETTNESDQFDLDDNVVFAIYLRDQMAGTSVNLKITRPDNSILVDWNYDLIDSYQVSHWYWINTVDMEGVWTWEATYQGGTTSHNFNVGALGTEDNNLTNTIIYPNPANEKLFIESEKTIVNVIIRDLLGRVVLQLNDSSVGINEIDLRSITKGMYFVSLTSDTNKTKTLKLIKK